MAEVCILKSKHVILDIIIGYIFSKLQVCNFEIYKFTNLSMIAALFEVIKRLIKNNFPVGH